MRLAATFSAMLISSPALAGGIGPLVMGGFHTEDVSYYSNRADAGTGPRFSDQAEYEQFQSTQVLGQIGSGLELMLGDRDDLIQGAFRIYWMMDTPQRDPATYSSLVEPDAIVSNIRTELRNVGVGTVGLQWGILRAASDKFKFGVSLHAGAGFLTPDRTEFFLVQPGVNVSYALTRTLEVYGDLTYGLRVRKGMSHGLYVTAGLRVMFD